MAAMAGARLNSQVLAALKLRAESLPTAAERKAAKDELKARSQHQSSYDETYVYLETERGIWFMWFIA